MSKEVFDMFQVKVTYKDDPEQVFFGRPCKYGIEREEFEKLRKKNILLIEEPVYGQLYEVDLAEFDVEEQPFGNWGQLDEETRMPNATDYDRYILNEYKEHLKRHEKAGEGIKKHKMFQVGVADGLAHYVITGVRGNNVTIEWRGFGADNYFDMTLGGGGSFPKHCIEPHIRWGDAKRKLFKKQK